MKTYDDSKYAKPSVTADMVIFARGSEAEHLEVLLIQRGRPPFRGQYALPGGFIPSTRQELANVLWTTAGKPDPVSTALYTDIPADAIEQQKAARWCAEQGLLSDHGATFGPDTKVTNARIIRAWNSLKKVPVTITK